MTNKLPVVGKRYRHKEDDTLVATVLGNLNKVKYVMCWDNRYNQDREMLLESFYENYEELPEDKAETKPETQNLELSPEAKEAIDSLRYELRLYESAPERRNEHYSRFKAIELLNVLDKQFNKTKESVDEEKIFFTADVGGLIEYQGKKYVCVNQTVYLPNEEPENWKECDYSSPEYKHIKIKFRDVFADNKTQAEEVVDNKVEAEESIWKPVSELPTPRDNRLDNIDLFLKLDTGKIIYAQGYKNDIEPIQNTSYEKYSAYNGNFCTLTDFINDYEKLKERVKKLENNTKNNF